MKRILPILCALACLLTACGRHYTATDLLAKITALPSSRDAVIYFRGADREGKGYLSKETAGLLYSGQDPMILCEDFALLLGKDDRLFEVHLYFALDGEKADAIQMILQQRQSILLRKDNELYVPDQPGVEVWRRGKWVALLATDDNSAVKELLKQMI